MQHERRQSRSTSPRARAADVSTTRADTAYIGPAGPNASVHAYAAAQVKAAMDATLRLGGENYVFWGGREGYHTLLNTDLKCGHWPHAREGGRRGSSHLLQPLRPDLRLDTLPLHRRI